MHASPIASRSVALDAWRGLAIVWMVAFHACYDLNHFGWWQPPQRFLSDPFWTTQRTVIVSLFMVVAGKAQACALQAQVGWRAFGRRWLQLLVCAALVSVATWVTFGPRWVSFGVLHAFAVMTVLARLTASWPRWLLTALAAVAWTLPEWLAFEALNARWAWFLGLGTAKPATEDVAPLFPWMGMVWLGLAWGPAALRLASAWPLWGGQAPLVRGLACVGRWPLTVYMLHQPLLWGLLLAAQPLRRATMGA